MCLQPVNADCLCLSVVLQTGKTVTSVSRTNDGKFSIKIEKRTINHVEHVKANYLMIASGGSEKVEPTLNHSGHIPIIYVILL